MAEAEGGEAPGGAGEGGVAAAQPEKSTKPHVGATPGALLGVLRLRWWPTWKSGGVRATAPDGTAANPLGKTHANMKRSMWCQRVALLGTKASLAAAVEKNAAMKSEGSVEDVIVIADMSDFRRKSIVDLLALLLLLCEREAAATRVVKDTLAAGVAEPPRRRATLVGSALELTRSVVGRGGQGDNDTAMDDLRDVGGGQGSVGGAADGAVGASEATDVTADGRAPEGVGQTFGAMEQLEPDVRGGRRGGGGRRGRGAGRGGRGAGGGRGARRGQGGVTAGRGGGASTAGEPDRRAHGADASGVLQPSGAPPGPPVLGNEDSFAAGRTLATDTAHYYAAMRAAADAGGAAGAAAAADANSAPHAGPLPSSVIRAMRMDKLRAARGRSVSRLARSPPVSNPRKKKGRQATDGGTEAAGASASAGAGPSSGVNAMAASSGQHGAAAAGYRPGGDAGRATGGTGAGTGGGGAGDGTAGAGASAGAADGTAGPGASAGGSAGSSGAA